MSDKPDILLMGLGRWGQNHLKTLVDLKIPVSVSDLDKELIVKAHKDYPGLVSTADMGHLDKYDGVIVATSPNTHSTIVKQLIFKNVKNILSEKPLALNYKDASEIFQLARVHGVNLQIGHQLRYTTGAELIRTFIRLYFDQRIKYPDYIVQYVNWIISVPAYKKTVPIHYDIMGHVLDLFLSCGIGYPSSIEANEISNDGNYCSMTLRWKHCLKLNIELIYGHKDRRETLDIESNRPNSDDGNNLRLDLRDHASPPLQLEIQDWISRFDTNKILPYAPDEKLYLVMDTISEAFEQLLKTNGKSHVMKVVL